VRSVSKFVLVCGLAAVGAAACGGGGGVSYTPPPPFVPNVLEDLTSYVDPMIGTAGQAM